MIKIPGQVGYKQTNRSDTLGSLWATFNIDLQSNQGKVRVSPRLKLGYSTANDADFGIPVAFRAFSGAIYTIAGTRIFANGGDPGETPWTEDASTGFATDYDPNLSDMEVFHGELVASTQDQLLSLFGGTWTVRDTLNAGSIHLMTHFRSTDRLYYTNQLDNILSTDGLGATWTNADPGADFAISLSPFFDFTITALKASSNYIWIGMSNTSSQGGTGRLFRWDGVSNQVDEFRLNNALGVMAIAIDPVTDTPYIMDSNGVLSYWNGNGITEVGRLPIPFAKLPYLVGSGLNDRFIHPNGMYFTKNGTIRCLINARAEVTAIIAMENMPSGVWEWDKEHGFVHIQSFSYNPADSATITDYGQNQVSRVGALVPMRIPTASPSNPEGDGTFLAGATYYTTATATTSGLFFDNSLDTIQKSGYLVTTKIFSENVEDTWQKFYVRHKKLLDSGDVITVKYRTSEEPPIEATITWTSTTTFTTTVDISAYLNYEVEILNGKGGGKTAKITAIVFSTPTYTVTVDSAFTGATSGTAKARFQKWIQIGTQTSQLQSFFETQVNRISTWIQFKITFQLKGVEEVDDFILSHEKHKGI